MACGCCGGIVPVKGWQARCSCRSGAGVALAGGTCTHWVALSSWLVCPGLLSLPSCDPQTPCKGRSCLFQGRTCVPGCLGCTCVPPQWWIPLRLSLELPGSAVLAHCQYFNLVPGENLFIKWGIFVSPSERKFVVKCQGLWWMSVLSDGWPHRRAGNLHFSVRNS